MKDFRSRVDRRALGAPISKPSISNGTVTGSLGIGRRQCARRLMENGRALRGRLRPALVQPCYGSNLGKRARAESPFGLGPAEYIGAVLAVADERRFDIDDRAEGRSQEEIPLVVSHKFALTVGIDRQRPPVIAVAQPSPENLR